MPRRAATVELTSARINKLPVPEHGAAYVYDRMVAGLTVRITSGGARTWVVVRRINGRPERLTLGRVESLPVGEARRAAQQLAGRIAAGEDVVEARRAERRAKMRLDDLWERYSAVRQSELRSWRDRAQQYRDYVEPALGRKPVAEIGPSDVQALADKIAGSGKRRTANKVVALVSAIYSWAQRRELVARNPAKGVERRPENARERFLRPDELPRFLAAVQTEPQPWRDYFLLALLTGARRAAVASMRWEDVDLASGVWHMPAWASKNGRPVAVALVDAAVELLAARSGDRIGPWVFPSSASVAGHIVEPRKPWLRVLKAAGLTDVRLHDVRRTVGSWLASSGASAFLIQKVLGHRALASTAVYARLDLNLARAAMNGVTGAMLGKPTAEPGEAD